MIEITHTHEEGTLLDGSRKGDGVYEIVRQHGFRYFPSIKAIGIQSSRDRVANRTKINTAAQALRAAGHDVTVNIDDTPRDRATVLADQTDRLDDRREHLQAKANRQASTVEALRAHSDRLVEHMPPGQPILIGHHSERGHRRLLERSQNAAFKALDLSVQAQQTSHRAAAVGSAAAYSATPHVTARRILTAEAEQRDLNRKIEGYTDKWGSTHAPAEGGYYEQLTARGALLHEQLTYDRMAIANAIAEGRYTPWNAQTVKVGDLVRSSWAWHQVTKVNKVTVSVKTRYTWDDKIKFVDIREARTPPAAA